MCETGECEMRPLESREERVCEMIKDVRKATRCDFPSCEGKDKTSM